jgi:hypothetical protein
MASGQLRRFSDEATPVYIKTRGRGAAYHDSSNDPPLFTYITPMPACILT